MTTTTTTGAARHSSPSQHLQLGQELMLQGWPRGLHQLQQVVQGVSTKKEQDGSSGSAGANSSLEDKSAQGRKETQEGDLADPIATELKPPKITIPDDSIMLIKGNSNSQSQFCAFNSMESGCLMTDPPLSVAQSIIQGHDNKQATEVVAYSISDMANSISTPISSAAVGDKVEHGAILKEPMVDLQYDQLQGILVSPSPTLQFVSSAGLETEMAAQHKDGLETHNLLEPSTGQSVSPTKFLEVQVHQTNPELCELESVQTDHNSFQIQETSLVQTVQDPCTDQNAECRSQGPNPDNTQANSDPPIRGPTALQNQNVSELDPEPNLHQAGVNLTAEPSSCNAQINCAMSIDSFLDSISLPIMQPLIELSNTPLLHISRDTNNSWRTSPHPSSCKRQSTRLAQKAAAHAGKDAIQIAQDLLAKKLGELTDDDNNQNDTKFDFYAQHLDRPIDKPKMEAITVLIEQGANKQKKGITQRRATMAPAMEA